MDHLQRGPSSVKLQKPQNDVAQMPTNPSHRDYFSINTTKIYSANPSGNFTVTSLPLTRRHLQDLESPSYYNLLFDLIANKFSKTPLQRRSSQSFAPPLQTATTKLIDHRRPTLSATKSAEAVLTPERREHQQSRGCTKSGFNRIQTTVPSSPIESQAQRSAQGYQRSQLLAANPEDRPLSRLDRSRPRNSPYENPSRIATRSVGALPTFSQHTPHEHYTEIPHRPPAVSTRSAEVTLPRQNSVFCGFHTRHSKATDSVDSTLRSQTHTDHYETLIPIRRPQKITSSNLSSTISLPASKMSLEHPHPSNPDSSDPFSAFENPHQKTTLFPQKAHNFFSRRAKKADRLRAAEEKAEQKQKERVDKAAKRMEKENADAARRADKEQREGAEQMRKLEMEVDKQRKRREEQVANMEKKRRREEKKEKVVELRRRKRALGNMSWGFDPDAGTRANRESGSGSVEANTSDKGRPSREHGEAKLNRLRKGATWGIDSGGPGQIRGHYSPDVSNG
ncbi:hypothetical protein EPUS_04520 [Endocarpon pusillum Z07020]|uniref:Uncharacterized protein n=1 Tax=Endocarpon pusillum (strain Z07020 / HMAS-L-300199) TaxID=1263415 RepID=U1GA27_ENDPU|nr:uncharacterized protein EPUS_04520 [Endocarpon pusillum Z07020]ERF68868.1 hypothetical protein EPUS_04520 [Endocarpon pusillum Z07020]